MGDNTNTSRSKVFLAAAFSLLACSGTYAEDDHGRFSAGPSSTLVTTDPDQNLRQLLAPFSYTAPDKLVWTSPKGEVVNGASIPQPLWSLVGSPFSKGNYRPAVIHDYYYCAHSRTRDDTDIAFYHSLLAAGKGTVSANLMYHAVDMWPGNEDWTINPNPPSPCNTTQSFATGNSTKTIPFSIENTLALKLGGFTRTLITTNGKILDVVNGEPIFAKSKRADWHTRTIRHLASKGLTANIEKIGLMSAIRPNELGNIEKISPWVEFQVPELDKFINMKELEISPPANYFLKNRRNILEPPLFLGPLEDKSNPLLKNPIPKMKYSAKIEGNS